MENKLSLSDDECVVVEFINESNRLSVAFTPWIKSKKKVQDLVKSLEEVEIWWPEGQDIVPAAKMKKLLLKKGDLIWKTHVVKIVKNGSKYVLKNQLVRSY